MFRCFFYPTPTKSSVNIVEWLVFNANVLDFRCRHIIELRRYCLRLGIIIVQILFWPPLFPGTLRRNRYSKGSIGD